LTSREAHCLLDILVAAEDAISFSRTTTFEHFEENALIRRAVLHCLMIIGEAAGRVEAAAEAEVPDLPWRRMKNLRNLLIHDYEGVDLPLIWQIVTVELPVVIAALDPLFPERPKP
jgi:uncharacterized protein with HEPN domain